MSHMFLIFSRETCKAILDDYRLSLFVTGCEEAAVKVWGKWQLPCIVPANFWSNNGEELVDLSQIALRNRTIHIISDNGYEENPELIRNLKAKGAEVSVIRLPKGEDLSSFLDRQGVEELYRLIRTAEDRKQSGKEDPKKKSKLSQAEKLINIAKTFKLFHDDSKEAFAFIDNQAIAIRSRAFKQRLSQELWLAEGKAPGAETLQQALNVIEAQAIFDGEPLKLFNRVGEFEGKFYYDLADGRVVEVTPEGWAVKKSPILFRRYSHQQRQVEPKRGGNIEVLFDFLNVSPEQKILTAVYLVACLVPEIPKPLVYGYGDKGSGKTTASMTFKKLLDPSKLEVLITPKDYNEVIQVLDHHAFVPFDNLSSFPDWFSDLLAQACTGGGFQKRMLYTDSDIVIYRIKRAIFVNGINLLIGRPDLMDRAILLHMERIPPNMRKTEHELNLAFDKHRPYLLGAMFDALSMAMRIHPTLKFDSLPRMADFIVWGSAVAHALGYKIDDFLTAYNTNIKRQNAEIISNNTLAQAVIQFMKDRDSWGGTVAEVYSELCELVAVSREDRTFPKHGNKLRKHLERIKDNLLDYDISFSIADFHTEKGVPITFQKLTTQRTANLSSGCSASSEVNKIKDLQAEDTLKIPEDTLKIPEDPLKVSSGCNLLKNKGNEHPEDTVDKILNFRGELL